MFNLFINIGILKENLTFSADLRVRSNLCIWRAWRPITWYSINFRNDLFLLYDVYDILIPTEMIFSDYKAFAVFLGKQTRVTQLRKFQLIVSTFLL